MPKLILKPYYEILITKEQEQQILEFLGSDDFAITVNGTTFSKSSFSRIEPHGASQVDSPIVGPGRRLKADNRSDDEQYKAARKASDIARKQLHKRGIVKTSERGSNVKTN